MTTPPEPPVVTPEPPLVIIVDDDDAVCDSLTILLRVNGYATRAFASATAFLAQPEMPDHGCVLTDVWMPAMDGIAMIRAMRGRGCLLPVVVLTGHGDVPTAVAALRAGALDFVEKPFHESHLLERLREASALGTRIAAEQHARRTIRERFALMSDREREVLTLVVEGLPNKIIAARLGISIRTVEIHRARVMEKSGAGSLSELVRFALTAGAVETAGDEGG